ncbi:Tfp pilus assembly protein FimT/FimU [Vogesella fluminis]|uniref:Uncharacterized protein n=1 Tax=Vogesella fluminis TaxID=1069161 RepID=A0ABQ3H7B2_9NEIS|nr:hypothetical protein [Vogesella fluminis]GHD71297.1 hypothetical protein GCM10011419_02840 [Vogesella fluminis]
MTRMHGFSLLQVLMALLLCGIALSLAIPAWSGMVRERTLQAYISRLNVLLLRARNDALLRQQSVHVCAVNMKQNQDPQGCFANPQSRGGVRHWSEGVLLYQDRAGGRPARYDSKEALQVLPLKATPAEPQLLVSVPYFEVGEWGGLKGVQSVSFMLQDRQGSCQQLLVSTPMRIRVSPC